MKKFRFLVLFLSILTLSACSKDDSPKDNPSSKGITGKWKADTWHIQGNFEGGSFLADGIDMGSISITFKDDGTFVSDGDQFTIESTVTMNGQQFSNRYTNENPFNSGTWEKVGDILKVKNDGEPDVYNYQIDRSTSNKLELSLDDYKLNEEDITGTFEAKMGFKR
jgi:hypothetical protein